MERVYSSLSEEERKEIRDKYRTKSASAEGVVVGGLGALVAYDIYRTRGLSDDQSKVLAAIKGESGRKMVDVAKYMRGRDKAVTVVDTGAKVDRFVKREGLDENFRGRLMGKMVRATIEQGNNAYAFRGRKGDYILGRGRMPKAVVDHEHGHIVDFREKGIVLDGSPTMGEYQRGFLHTLAQMAWKPSYRRGRYRAETEAWRHAGTSKRDKDLEEAALRTYDKSFHANRAAVTGLGLAAYGLRRLV